MPLSLRIDAFDEVQVLLAQLGVKCSARNFALIIPMTALPFDIFTGRHR